MYEMLTIEYSQFTNYCQSTFFVLRMLISLSSTVEVVFFSLPLLTTVAAVLEGWSLVVESLPWMERQVAGLVYAAAPHCYAAAAAGVLVDQKGSLPYRD